MEIAIKTVAFAKCGHINIFLEDGRQITIHKRDLYEKMELAPEVEEAILQIQIREKVKAILDAMPLSKDVTEDIQRASVKSVMEASQVII